MTVKELIKSLPPGVVDLEIKMDVGEVRYQPLSRILKVTDDDGVEAIMLIPQCFYKEYKHD